MNTLHTFDEVFDTQTVFRLVLEAMANPTRTVSIAPMREKLFGNNPTFLALAMTLLDNEVTFHTCGDAGLKRDIQLVTLAEEASMAEADYLFLPDVAALVAAMAQAKCGTLVNPHQSATLLIRDNGEKTQQLSLYGAGIEGDTLFSCSEVVRRALELRQQQEYEYPTGVDFVFASDSGDITCIPRLVKRREQIWHM